MFIIGSPPPPRSLTYNSKTALRIAHIIAVSEEFGGWVLGHLVSDPTVSVELGFEQWDKFLASDWTLLGTSIVYLRMDRGREHLFEAQFGKVQKQPDYKYILKAVRDLVALFRDYEPRMMPPRSYPRELSLHSLSERQDRRDRQPVLRKSRHKKAARMRGLRR